MKALYNTIIQKLTSNEATTAYHNANVPRCKFVDLYRGQYLNWEGFDSFPLPAVLFEFNITHNNNDIATATITLHICYEQPQDTSSISRTKENALKFFDFVDVTFKLLQDLESEHTGKLELVSEEMVKDDAIVNVHLLTYTCQYSGRESIEESKYECVKGENLEINGGLVDRIYDL